MKTAPIYQRVHGLLTERGFERAHRLYFRRNGDILSCICFDAPPGSVYCQYFVMPLYMPFSAVTYTYGKRMHTRLHSPDPVPPAEEMDKWQASFEKELLEDAEPFFARAERAMTRPSPFLGTYAHWNCMKLERARALSYSAVYRKRKWTARILLRRYQALIGKCTVFSESYLVERTQEHRELTDLLKAGETDTVRYFETIIARNVQQFCN